MEEEEKKKEKGKTHRLCAIQKSFASITSYSAGLGPTITRPRARVRL